MFTQSSDYLEIVISHKPFNMEGRYVFSLHNIFVDYLGYYLYYIDL